MHQYFMGMKKRCKINFDLGEIYFFSVQLNVQICKTEFCKICFNVVGYPA